MPEVIAFDGDDTLWHSESYFTVTQERVGELLAPYVDRPDLDRELLRTERRNLELYGYGVKGFTLSLLETAVAVSDRRVTADELQTILAWGKEMLQHPVELLDGVEETLDALQGDYRLVLVTKGDLFHQESKVATSGLAERFEHLEIVSEKDAGTYHALARRAGIATDRLMMVGNSVRSDIAPVLEAGGIGVHIPYHVTWAHEIAEPPARHASDRLHELDDVRELPGLLEELEPG